MGRTRVVIAWILLVASGLGWPASAVWVRVYMDKWSPFEQLMLFLSWAAIGIVAADFLTTAQVRQEQGRDRADDG